MATAALCGAALALLATCGAGEGLAPTGGAAPAGDTTTRTQALAYGAHGKPYRVTFDAWSASNTASATTGTVTQMLGRIPKGTPVTLSTCGAATSGDTYLRLYAESGGQWMAIGENDDADSDNLCSRISFTTDLTRRYKVEAGCYAQNGCSGVMTFESSYGPAEAFAPVVYQDTWPGHFTVEGDYITRLNYDLDYDATNNKANLFDARYRKPGYIYVAQSETRTHFFLGYYFFHPNDANAPHVNDLESMVLAVRKDGVYGQPEAMITNAHGYFYQTLPAGSANGCGSACPNDGTLQIEGDDRAVGRAGHPRVYVEPGGHGVLACDGKSSGALRDAPQCEGNDGVVYAYEGGLVETPDQTATSQCANGSSAMSATSPACGYGLIAMEESGGLAPGADGTVNQGLWYLRNNIRTSPPAGVAAPFSSFWDFQGGGANTPMQWGDDTDHTYHGDWLCDPARLFDAEFNGPSFDAGFSHDYLDHRYWTHKAEVTWVWGSNIGPNEELWVDVASADADRSHASTRLNRTSWMTKGSNGWNQFSFQAPNPYGQKWGGARNFAYYCLPAGGQTLVNAYRNGTRVGAELATNTVDFVSSSSWACFGDCSIAVQFRVTQNPTP